MPQMKPKLTRKKPSFWDESFHRKGVAMLTWTGTWKHCSDFDWTGGVGGRGGEETGERNQEGRRGIAVSVGVAAVLSGGWRTVHHRCDFVL